MILTFAMDKHGSLDIFFDEEGRDRLIELLSSCKKPGDHQHLWCYPDNVIELTPGRFLKDSTPVSNIELGMPGPGMKIILNEAEESEEHR